jgi:hypothetical protein
MSPKPDTTTPAARFTRLALLVIFALLALVFAFDFAWYHVRLAVPKYGAANGSVHRVRMLAILNKGNKLDYQIDENKPEEDVPCSRTLFPQSGGNPCWYVKRHANDPIRM